MKRFVNAVVNRVLDVNRYHRQQRAVDTFVVCGRGETSKLLRASVTSFNLNYFRKKCQFGLARAPPLMRGRTDARERKRRHTCVSSSRLPKRFVNVCRDRHNAQTMPLCYLASFPQRPCVIASRCHVIAVVTKSVAFSRNRPRAMDTLAHFH